MSLLPSAVEEMLRYNPAVIHFRRTASADTELRGKKIRKGDKVLMWYPSANRDEDVFEDGQRFDIGRSPQRAPRVRDRRALLPRRELGPHFS